MPKEILAIAEIVDDTILAEIAYPRQEEVKFVEVGLIDVRAADNIRISYDFERDGWKIEQASTFSWEDAKDTDPDWQEVAFIQAWARKKIGPGDKGYIWKDYPR